MVLLWVDGVYLVCRLHVVFLVSSHRCRFLTSSQSREGRKIPKNGLSLFFQVILGGICPPLPLLCTHTNTQTCKYMVSADLSAISHGYAGTGSCFRSWLTHTHTHMLETGTRVIEMNSTVPWEQEPSIRRKRGERDGDTERSRHVFLADAAVLFPGNVLSSSSPSDALCLFSHPIILSGL